MNHDLRRFNFTKATLLALKLPAQGERTTYYDTRTRGLNLIVTDRGTKTFYVRRKLNGLSERVLLGRFPDLTIEQARGKASDMNAAFAQGQNPAELRRLARAEPTLGELMQEYLDRYAKHHTKTWQETEANFRRYLSNWKNRKVSTITRNDVQRLHTQLGNVKGHHTANRVLELLSAVFNKGIFWGHGIAGNPTTGIPKFRLKARDRFIQGDELPRFFRAVAEESNESIRDYILLSLLTGARKANVLAMRWEEVNLERHAWRIPDTKNGESLTLPLSTEACAILKYRFEKRINDFVFPGTGKTAHMISPKKGWKRVLDRITLHDVIELVGDAQNRTRDQIEEMQQAARADERRALSTYKAIAKGLSIDISGVGLKNLRIHDLRRTLGSWQAATGASLAIIGKSLGHKDVSTTAIYARLSLDPVRQAMETATSAMLRAGGVGSDADVIMLSLPTRVPLRA